MGCKVNYTSSGYMDKDVWLKSMTRSSSLYCPYLINNKILFFDGNSIHFDDHALCFMEEQNIQPFVNNPGKSGNDNTNDNGLHEKLNSYYNKIKSSWTLKYETTQFTSPHELNIGGSMGRI